jgi:hypothetical protein
MDSREITRDRPVVGWLEAERVLSSAPDPIDAELQLIVDRAGRRAPVRRALQRAGQAFARWLDNLVPPATRSTSDDPELPVYRFPFF